MGVRPVVCATGSGQVVERLEGGVPEDSTTSRRSSSVWYSSPSCQALAGGIVCSPTSRARRTSSRRKSWRLPPGREKVYWLYSLTETSSSPGGIGGVSIWSGLSRWLSKCSSSLTLSPTSSLLGERLAQKRTGSWVEGPRLRPAMPRRTMRVRKISPVPRDGRVAFTLTEFRPLELSFGLFDRAEDPFCLGLAHRARVVQLIPLTVAGRSGWWVHLALVAICASGAIIIAPLIGVSILVISSHRGHLVLFTEG